MPASAAFRRPQVFLSPAVPPGPAEVAQEEKPFLKIARGLRELAEEVAVPCSDAVEISTLFDVANSLLRHFRNQIMMVVRNSPDASEQITELVDLYNRVWDQLYLLESRNKIIGLLVRDLHLVLVPQEQEPGDEPQKYRLEEEGVESLPTWF